MKRLMTTFNCDYCGKEKTVRNNSYTNRKHHYCSVECHCKSLKTGDIVECFVCGKEVYRQRHDIEKHNKFFCSHKCQAQGENNSNFKDETIHYKCEQCGEKCKQQKREYSRYKFHFCSHICKVKYFIKNGIQSLENSPTWRGGKSFEKYGTKWTKKLKEFIRNRDNRTCRECKKTEDELAYLLSVHHIDYNKKNNSKDNLISLCRSCHSKTNFNRQDWKKHYINKSYL